MKNYYDFAASTPMSPFVINAMSPWLGDNFSNTMASHLLGQNSFDAVENSRRIVANKIGAMPSEIIFTSGASESNNLAIKGIAFANLKNKGHIITSAIEHKCILNACAYLETIGFSVTYIQPDKYGFISPSNVKQSIRPDTILISIHHVNNELGTIQPIAELGKLGFEYEIPFHTDAAQSFCKCQLDVDTMNIDMLSLSGHKIYGPKGVGALYVRNARESNLVPLIHGGGHELGLRGGTHPTPLIVGLAAAIEVFPAHPVVDREEVVQRLKEYGCIFNGSENALPTILNVTFPDIESRAKFFRQNPWLVSQGAACNAVSNKPSHVLTAIGLDEDVARLTYRVSLPPYAIDG